MKAVVAVRGAGARWNSGGMGGSQYDFKLSVYEDFT